MRPQPLNAVRDARSCLAARHRLGGLALQLGRREYGLLLNGERIGICCAQLGHVSGRLQISDPAGCNLRLGAFFGGSPWICKPLANCADPEIAGQGVKTCSTLKFAVGC